MEVEGKERVRGTLWSLYQGFGIKFSFTLKGTGNTEDVGTGSFGELSGGKVKFSDAPAYNPHIIHHFVLK